MANDCCSLRIVGGEDITITQGEDLNLAAGVYAYDSDGESVPLYISPSEIDTCEVGQHRITYTARGKDNQMLPSLLCGEDEVTVPDLCGNLNTVTKDRTITIEEADPPVIRFDRPTLLQPGEMFDPLEGVYARDANGNRIEPINYEGWLYDMVSGDIASFDTDLDYRLKSLVVFLEPIQSGSGTPSPSNVRPISGHDDVDVVHTGKNLVDLSNVTSGLCAYHSGDTINSHYASQRYAYSPLLWAKDGLKLITKSSNLTDYNYIAISCFDDDGNWVACPANSISALDTNVTLTVQPNIYTYARVWYGAQGNTMGTTVKGEVMCVKGTTAPTTYEPYNGEEIHKEIEATYTPTVQENEPYQFKRTGDVGGDRESIELVGGTVAWNQLVQIAGGTRTIGGITATIDENGLVTLSGTSTGGYAQIFDNANAISGHKYVRYFNVVANPNNVTFYPMLFSVGWTEAKDMCSAISTISAGVGISGFSAGTDFTGVKFKTCIIDLTQFFGSSTIADYVYSLEQGTPGSGIAWLRKYYPKLFTYNPYNVGELISVNASSHDTVGFNQWDEEWELGSLNSSGNKVSADASIRTKNYVQILPSTTYYYKAPNGTGRTCFYDENKNHINADVAFSANATFLTPTNAYYMMFVLATAYGTTYKNDICINISDPTKNGTYEPYVKNTYPLDSSRTLKGIFKLDANNNLYAYGDTYPSDGNGTERFTLVDLGSITPTKYDVAQGTLFRFPIGTTIKKSVDTATLPNIICAKYVTVTNASRTNKTISMANNTEAVDIVDNDYSSASAIQTAMNGVYLLYEKATPTSFTAEPFESIQEVTPNYGTEEFVTTTNVPVGNNTQYLTRDIYGGYIDLVSGVLTVDRKYYDLTDIPFVVTSGGAYYAWVNNSIPFAAGRSQSDAIMSHFVYGISDDCLVGTNDQTGHYILFYPDKLQSKYGIGSLADLLAFLQAQNEIGTPVQLCYKLATPLTYQLTPEQINAFIGQNNIWSEDGEVSVIFAKSIPKEGEYAYPVDGSYPIEYWAEDKCGNGEWQERTIWVGHPNVPV